MSSVSHPLSEPIVLSHIKRTLFPENDDDEAYAVVDTQFAMDEWRKEEPVDPAVRQELAPFNHIQIGGGYPDLVGVRKLEDEFLTVNRIGEEPPLIVIEAKGYAGGDVDTERGIMQAYDRLQEANAAFLAAPANMITKTDRTLARELNIGVLGVNSGGTVTPIEVPRVVGNRTTTEAKAIRFQAGAQGVADQSFGLNHPKNYIAYPLAFYAEGNTAEILSEHKVVRDEFHAEQGAMFLGLVESNPDGIRLTSLGQEVVRFAISEFGSVDAALSEFVNWYRSRKCFVDLAPKWGQLTRRVMYEYPATKLLVSEIQEMHNAAIEEPSLVDLILWLHNLHPSFTVELFFKGNEEVHRRVFAEDGALQESALGNGDAYHSPTVCQLKTMLYHAGILTESGTMSNQLDPYEDIWALRVSV